MENYFGIPNQSRVNPIVKCEIECESVLEGADIIYELLPVSKKTGHRMSTLSLLKLSLSPKYQHLIPQILAELPTCNSDPSLSDEDRCSMMAFRLCDGTPSEKEMFAKQLLSVIPDIAPKVDEAVKSSDTIQFNENDGSNNE